MGATNIKFRKYRLAERLDLERLKKIMEIVSKYPQDVRILDIGCCEGNFSRMIAEKYRVVASDVRSYSEWSTTPPNLEFIQADIFTKPFESQSFDVVVCASMLEHIKDIDGAVTILHDMLKPNGALIAGYPIEGKLFKFIWKHVSPEDYEKIRRAGHEENQKAFIYKGQIMDYWTHPATHKHTWQTIRKALQKQGFSTMKKCKLPGNFLPDILSYYECAELKRT